MKNFAIKFFSRLVMTLLLVTGFEGTSWSAEGDVHDMSISFSQLLNNNASITPVSIPAQSYSIKSITINWRYNKATENVVTISVSVGGVSWGTQSVGTNTTSDAVFSGASATGAVEITFTNNAGSGTGKGTFYVNSVSLTEGSSGVVSTCSTPSFSLPEGAYYGTQSVELSCATIGSTIYYTTNGATPSTSSSVYSSAISVSSNTTIKAYAVKDGCNDSEVATATYTIKPTIPGYAIDFEESPEAYVDWTMTNIGIHTSGLTCGGHNDSDSWGSNVNNSDNGTATAIIQTLNKVDYPNVFTCYISKESSNTTSSTWKIQVSSNGTDWVDIASTSSMTQNSWTEFSGDIKSAGYSNVYVRLYYNGSSAKRAVDDINLSTYVPSSIATPTFSPNGGTYFSSQDVTISCETDGATIFYTTDGSVPSESNGIEGTNVTISSTTTLKAIAIKAGDSSEVATADYSFPTVYSTIPDLFGAATASETDVYVSFDNWVVSGVSTNGKNIYVTDNSGNGFILYYGTDQSSTYSAGKVLSGSAVPCRLVLYHGAAELKNVDASDLTINNGGTVTPAGIDMASLSGVNTGALVSYENLLCSYENSKYYLSDGVTTIQVYNSIYAFDALTPGTRYDITGVYAQYDSTKEIMPRSSADIEETVIIVPTVSVASPIVNAIASGASGTIEVSYENFILDSADLVFYESDGTTPASYDHSWLTASINASNNVAYSVARNSGGARVAYFKVYALDGSANEYFSNLISITQAAASVSYAVLPFTFNDGKSGIDSKEGLSHTGLGSDYKTDNTKLKFDSAEDELILKINEAPGTLTFSIKGNGSGSDPWAGTFTIQTSTDGTVYSDVASYTSLGDEELKTVSDLASDVRYIKWIYTTKTAGNVGLGNINLTKPASNPATITITATENGGKYYTTFYNGSARYVLPAGAKAFTMNSDHELYQLGADGSVIPSGTAVIIIAENASITLTKSDDESAIAVNGGANILQGSNSPKDIYSISGTPYVLGIVTGTLGFYEFTGDGIPAYKAYYEN